MKKLLCVLIVLASMFAITPTIAADDSPVFELRIYTTHPGKMPNLLGIDFLAPTGYSKKP